MIMLSISKLFLKSQLLLFIYFLASCAGGMAQSTVQGKIIDHTDKKPLAFVNVFLSNATIGSQTAADGTFLLKGIKPGTYELVVSMVGFETQRQTITLNNSILVLPDIELKAKVIELHEVVVKPIDEADREKYLEIFTAQFLGPSDLAGKCKITNPSVIDFDPDLNTGVLKATSSDFIIIENEALGYRIKYLLTDFKFKHSGIGSTVNFNGSVLFENLAGSDSQKLRWKKKRLEVYEGSEMHFLRSLLNNTIDADGFMVFQFAIFQNPERPLDSVINARIKYFNDLKQHKAKSSLWRDSIEFWKRKSQLPPVKKQLYDYPLNRDEIFKYSDKDGIYALGCDFDGLYIGYNKNHHQNPGSTEKQRHFDGDFSTVNFNSLFSFFDTNGWVLNPYSRTFSGAWGQYRVAGMLPADYDPDEK